MKIKALRGAFGDYGSVKRGQIIDVADSKAQQLVKRGTFVPVQGDMAKGAAKSASSRPSKASRTGGRTGAEKRSSSSPADPAPKTSTSVKSKDDAGSLS